jgi:1-deoxy-D-xylulose-5-phosphate reductoisomerase
MDDLQPLHPYGHARRAPAEPLRLLVLGATGSIGRQTLDLVRSFPERLQVTGVAVHRRWDDLPAALATLPGPAPLVAVADLAAHTAAAAAGGFGDRLLPSGVDPAADLVDAAPADVVVNGLVGAAGLGPTLAAARRGLRIALANKESLVMGGDLVREAVVAGGAELLPVDSEHAAIAQCLWGRAREDVARLVLTASGGPFRETPAAQLAEVTLADVLAHPTWTMGPKITVDSATLMNKGLEVIEARHLFGLPDDRIDVVVHPGSWVHSLVEFVDGSVLAQLGEPDMRLPLLYAITGERRWPLAGRRFDLLKVGTLRFEAPDLERFPCLRLAREAGRAGGAAPVILNAANEVATAALLAGELRYIDIAATIARCLDSLDLPPPRNLPEVLAVDAQARVVAASLLMR